MTEIDSSAMKSRKPASKPKPRPRDVAKLHPISDEMLQWSTLLEAELLTWPNTLAKPMFGFRAFYRGKFMFAAVPRSREFDPRGSFLLKFDPMTPALLQRKESDPRIGSWSREFGRGWLTFTLNSGEDLRDALWWLQQSHASAKGKAAK